IKEEATTGVGILSVIPDQYFAEIGRIAAAWAMLDFQLDVALREGALEPQLLEACISAQILSTPNRLRALGSLLRLHGIREHRIEFLNKFEQRTHAVGIKRNRAIHDAIIVGHETARVYRMTVAMATDKSLDFGLVPS